MITYTFQLTFWCFYWCSESCIKVCPFRDSWFRNDDIGRAPKLRPNAFQPCISKCNLQCTSHFRCVCKNRRAWPLQTRAWDSKCFKIASSLVYIKCYILESQPVLETTCIFSDNCECRVRYLARSNFSFYARNFYKCVCNLKMSTHRKVFAF